MHGLSKAQGTIDAKEEQTKLGLLIYHFPIGLESMNWAYKSEREAGEGVYASAIHSCMPFWALPNLFGTARDSC